MVACKTRYGFGIVMGELPGLLVKIVHAFPIGANPYVTVGRGNDLSNVVRNQAFRVLFVVSVSDE